MLILHSLPHHVFPHPFPHAFSYFISDTFAAMELQRSENRTSFKPFSLSPNFFKLDSARLPRQPPSLKYFYTVWLCVIQMGLRNITIQVKYSKENLHKNEKMTDSDPFKPCIWAPIIKYIHCKIILFTWFSVLPCFKNQDVLLCINKTTSVYKYQFLCLKVSFQLIN